MRGISRHWAEMGCTKPLTPHDLRRILPTKLTEIGVSDIVAERVLDHKLQGIMAVINRHAYDVEKRQAVVLWKSRLRQILGLLTT